MKRIKYVLMTLTVLLIVSVTFAQNFPNPNDPARTNKYYRNFTAYDMFKGEVPDSQIVANADSALGDWKYWTYRSDSTENIADTTVYSKVFPAYSGDIYFFARVRTNSDTINTTIHYGIWRGPGYDTDGWEWHTVGTATADAAYELSVSQQSWNTDDPADYHCIKITHTSMQSNDYIFIWKFWDWKNP